jgi:hypothetical protein
MRVCLQPFSGEITNGREFYNIGRNENAVIQQINHAISAQDFSRRVS